MLQFRARSYRMLVRHLHFKALGATSAFLMHCKILLPSPPKDTHCTVAVLFACICAAAHHSAKHARSTPCCCCASCCCYTLQIIGLLEPNPSNNRYLVGFLTEPCCIQVSSITLASSASSAAPSPAGAAPSPASATSAPAKLIANLGNVTLLNRLRPQLPGTAILTGSFGGKPVTSTLSITLGGPSTAVTVASVELSATWCTSGSSDIQCSVTFAGLPGATNVLEVRLPVYLLSFRLF